LENQNSFRLTEAKSRLRRYGRAAENFSKGGVSMSRFAEKTTVASGITGSTGERMRQ